MATGSKGASSKKSPASTYSSAIVFLLILIFVTRSSALDVVLSLVLLVTIVIWVVQGQRAKATRSKSGGYHESASNEQDLGIVNRSTTKQKHVIERRPRSPAGRADKLSDPPDKGLLGGSFAALTDALSDSFDEPSNHLESARPQQRHPELAYSQHQGHVPHPSPQAPGSP